MQEHFSKNWIRYIVSFSLGIAIFILYVSLRHEWSYIIHYVNGLFIGGALQVGIGGLAIVNYFGGFDIYQYIFASKKQNGAKPALYDFSQEKKEKRKKNRSSFLPYFLLGALFILVAFILSAFLPKA